MPAPSYAAADFLASLQALIPTGPIWPRDPDAVMTQVLAALAPIYERSSGRAGHLLVDAFPVAPVELLAEWEHTLGLPDPCAGPSPTLQTRQRAVAAAFIAQGGQSIGYITAVAAALGYTITITQFTAYRCGMRFGQPMCGLAWMYAWQVNGAQFPIQRFQFGRDNFGEPFQTYQTSQLQCTLQRLAPAHTQPLFSFT